MERALVTGGGSGIGLALSKALIARGDSVIVADLDSAAARAAADEAGAAFLAVDLRDAAASARLIETAWTQFGAVDLIASNAGVSRNKRLLREPLDAQAHALFDVNAFAAVRLAQAFRARLDADGRTGRILITASENSLSVPAAVKTFGLGLYAASKHAVLALAEWLATENGDGRLNVHVLLPGPVYSPAVAAAIPDPAAAPPGFDLISCEACAAIALRGLDLGLFYIPTHAHLLADMTGRRDGVAHAIAALQLT
jgi:NAD(P)-dependent dehydrogenase (short-subunit alcohol dehydrogenase family)